MLVTVAVDAQGTSAHITGPQEWQRAHRHWRLRASPSRMTEGQPAAQGAVAAVALVLRGALPIGVFIKAVLAA